MTPRQGFKYLAALLALIVSSVSESPNTENVLSRSELLKVLKNIVNPHLTLKINRNKELDKQIESVIAQILSVEPEITELHGYLHNLTMGAQILKSAISDPLLKIRNSLEISVGNLNRCRPLGVQVPHPTPAGSLSESSEEHVMDQSEFVPYYENEKRKRSFSDSDLVTGYISPLDNEVSTRLEDILKVYSENTVVSLRDVVMTARSLAAIVSQMNLNQYNSQISKLSKSKNLIETIVEDVKSANIYAAGFNNLVRTAIDASLNCIKELNSVTKKIQDISTIVC